MQVTRLTQLPLPSYTYIPGKTPHPVRDPAGHSYRVPDPQVETFSKERWSECEAFLFGIDLFNAGYFWEAHEQWEAVWHAVGRRGTVADFFKGLIKMAAAGVKLLEGKPVGVGRHARRAAELFLKVEEEQPTCCGLELLELHAAAMKVVAQRVSFNSLGIELRPKR